mmetsp:Transcript_6146/g.12623  ORF Transcript_6146/g.12623 Transcript_6146/m.12623 type:complete len:238 (-) Transcript_6146:4802-5515(-)
MAVGTFDSHSRTCKACAGTLRTFYTPWNGNCNSSKRRFNRNWIAWNRASNSTPTWIHSMRTINPMSFCTRAIYKAFTTSGLTNKSAPPPWPWPFSTSRTRPMRTFTLRARTKSPPPVNNSNKRYKRPGRQWPWTITMMKPTRKMPHHCSSCTRKSPRRKGNWTARVPKRFNCSLMPTNKMESSGGWKSSYQNTRNNLPMTQHSRMPPRLWTNSKKRYNPTRTLPKKILPSWVTFSRN